MDGSVRRVHITASVVGAVAQAYLREKHVVLEQKRTSFKEKKTSCRFQEHYFSKSAKILMIYLSQILVQ